MIHKEFYRTRKDGISLYRTYSDKGVMILQKDTNHLYDEAIDVEGSLHTYEETEYLIGTEREQYENS